jgi:hypothetical protein
MLRRTIAIAGAGLILSLELLSSALPAGTDQWKDESPEAAERQLEKMRSAASKLDRFEVECLISQVDNTFAKDERWRLRAYAEEGTGFRAEMRPVDLKHMTARQSKSGGRCELSTKAAETWVCKGETCTVFNETERTYDAMSVGQMSWLAPIKSLPHQFIPPWLDPLVDWKNLKSRYRIERASSTDTEFLVEFSRHTRPQERGFRRIVDERLEAIHELIIDRRTGLPKRWRMIGCSGTQDRIAIYERIDLHPAKRDLKVVLTGYQDARKIAQAAAKNQPPSKDDGEPLRTIQFAACCFRVLTWCPL